MLVHTAHMSHLGLGRVLCKNKWFLLTTGLATGDPGHQSVNHRAVAIECVFSHHPSDGSPAIAVVHTPSSSSDISTGVHPQPSTRVGEAIFLVEGRCVRCCMECATVIKSFFSRMGQKAFDHWTLPTRKKGRPDEGLLGGGQGLLEGHGQLRSCAG